MQTLNNHISLFNSFANNHLQVNSFGFGDFSEAIEKPEDGDLQYPRMWVDLTSTTFNENELRRNFRVAFMDLVRPDERNENDVLSDMEQLALDFLAFITKGNIGDQDLVRSGDLEPFTEATADVVSGMFLNVSIVQNYGYDYCSVPISGAPTGFGSCLPVRIFENGVVIATIESGGSYTVTGGDVTIYKSDGVTVVQVIAAPGSFTIPTHQVLNTAATVIATAEYDQNTTVADSVVSNSDDSYVQSVPATTNLELPDQTIDVNLDGVLIETVTYPAMTEPDITIVWQ